MEEKRRIQLLLTGTIRPFTNFVTTDDEQFRRNEYLKTLHYYSRFAEVVFLENSLYPIESDSEFASIPNVTVVKCTVDRTPSGEIIEPERGKGFFEFKMIEEFILAEFNQNNPQNNAYFLKISGRYIIENIEAIMREVEDTKSSDFVIDIFRWHGVARTSLILMKKDFYANHFLDLYQKVDDSKGTWVEKVLFNIIRDHKMISTTFKNEPIFSGVSGSTGAILKRNFMIQFLKISQRKLSQCFSKQYLLFR